LSRLCSDIKQKLYVVIFQIVSGLYYFTFGEKDDSLNAVQTTTNTITHFYSVPGYYIVSVVASTATGNASTEIVVLIESMFIE